MKCNALWAEKIHDITPLWWSTLRGTGIILYSNWDRLMLRYSYDMKNISKYPHHVLYIIPALYKEWQKCFNQSK